MVRGRRGTTRRVGRRSRPKIQIPTSSRDILVKPDARMDYADDEWQSMYRWLAAYKDLKGHACVAHGTPGTARLAAWCQKQRASRAAQTMSSYKICCLNMVGFIWNEKVNQWTAMFMLLLAFQQTHGTLQVDAARDYPLASWIRSNQIAYYSGTLAKECVDKLQAIGFDWGDPPKTFVSTDYNGIDFALARMEEWITREILE